MGPVRLAWVCVYSDVISPQEVTHDAHGFVSRIPPFSSFNVCAHVQPERSSSIASRNHDQFPIPGVAVPRISADVAYDVRCFCR